MRLSSLKLSCSVLGLSACSLWASSALAQQSIALPGITVQGATLEAQPASRPQGRQAASSSPSTGQGEPSSDVGGVPIEQIGAAVTVITGEQLRAQQVRHVGDALRSLPGVHVGRTGGPGNLTQVRIRGAEGSHTLVLIDGIEANSTTEGEFDFSNLSAEDIDRIEVIRGPMSALYGSNAVGGVINIITSRGRGPATVTLRSEFGSLGTKDVAGRFSAGNDTANVSLGAHWKESNGFNISPFGNEDDGLRLASIAMTAGAKLAPNVSVDFTLRNTDKKADRDGFGGTPGTLSTAIDDTSRLHDTVFLAGTRLRWDTFGGALTHEFRANYNSSTIGDRDMMFPAFPFVIQNLGERNTFAYLATQRFSTPALLGGKHSVTGLIEKESESFVREGDVADGQIYERERLSFAGEWRGGFADQLFLTAGIRHDDNDTFDDFTTWRVAGSWVLRPLGLRPHASIGTAVKFPAMFEQFGEFGGGFFRPNPALKPEESFGWDAGIEVTLPGSSSLDVTYFRSNLENKIASSGLFVGPSLINLPGESTRGGVEVALRTRLLPSLMTTVAYTHLDAQEPSGVQEIRRPRHSGRVDLAYTFAAGRGTANLGVAYNGSMTDDLFVNGAFFPVPAGRVSLDDYWLINLAASYKLQPGVELFGRVENLLDQKYQEVFGFESQPVMAFAGIKLTFGGPEGVGGSWAK